MIIVNTTLLMSAAVVLETALSYLGFGITRPTHLWGWISANQSAFRPDPGCSGGRAVHHLIALSANFIGDGLRDAFDPRTKRIPSEAAMRKAMAQLEASPEKEGTK